MEDEELEKWKCVHRKLREKKEALDRVEEAKELELYEWHRRYLEPFLTDPDTFEPFNKTLSWALNFQDHPDLDFKISRRVINSLGFIASHVKNTSYMTVSWRGLSEDELEKSLGKTQYAGDKTRVEFIYD